MACDITLGRNEPCKDQVGGVTAIYFINFGDVTGVTYDSTGNTDEITDLGAGVTAYKYEVKGASSLEETINSSRDTGTTFFSQVVTATLKKKDSDTTEQVKLLSYGRPIVVVEDLNGNSVICGINEGCEVTGTFGTGTAKGDLNGYTLTATGEEARPAATLQGAVAGDPFAGMSTSVTVVTGTNS